MDILHIHQDYPDGRKYPYTKAVSNLIESCKSLSPCDTHTVVSINRTSNPFKISMNNFSQGYSFIYWSIPVPIIYYLTMRLAAYFIYRKIKHLRIDVIHGHKFTCEGLIAYFLSKKFKKPYLISIRGGSDFNNINRMKLHKGLFKRVFVKSKKIFWVSAWAKDPIEKLFSVEQKYLNKNWLLPNICKVDHEYPHVVSDKRKGYVTAISYHQYKRKGLKELIESISILNKCGSAIELSIYGSGDDVYRKEIEEIISKNDANSFIFLKGQVSQDVLLQAMSKSKGLLMPAVNETFGMAYVEALSVGCPILYVKNTGIDGYFCDVNIGGRVTNVTVDELKIEIAKIDKNHREICEDLKLFQKNKTLEQFTSQSISELYLSQLTEVSKVSG